MSRKLTPTLNPKKSVDQLKPKLENMGRETTSTIVHAHENTEDRKSREV